MGREKIWTWPDGSTAGEVVEWLMAPVLKTGEVKASVGSNPTLSVPGTAPVPVPAMALGLLDGPRGSQGS